MIYVIEELVHFGVEYYYRKNIKAEPESTLSNDAKEMSKIEGKPELEIQVEDEFAINMIAHQEASFQVMFGYLFLHQF